jgi:DNA replication and repair protein RecF
MYLTHLSLTHFRNYHRLELDFRGPLTLLQGENAQGKTNLLEAIYFLATSKPVHAQSEREAVDWAAGDEPIPYARVAGRLRAGDRDTDLEILLTPRENGRGDGLNYKKQVKINGVARRSLDLVGTLRAVLFLPEDIRLVDGAPAERRRYLDVALCQLDRAYCRSLLDYQRVLEQRNSLLRTLREQGAQAGAPAVEAQLGFWDERLVQAGSAVVAARHQFLRELGPLAAALQADFSGGRETLALQYLPSFNPGHLDDADFARLGDEQAAAALAAHPVVALYPELVARHFTARLRAQRWRELEAGATLYGPHRDDFRLLVNGRDLRLYGSRGQQRSGALALKLAEVRAMTRRSGTPPVLLLDDVMSELDAGRRRFLLGALDGIRQAVVTTTDWDDFTPEFRRRARNLVVRDGALHEAPATSQDAPGDRVELPAADS